jgi:putative hydrolases of HD superfamily
VITKTLALKLQDGAAMQRWNDKIRPVELRELDKQAHKMVIAYFLGKFEEHSQGFSWLGVIEGGLFEFLQRLVVTDLKPQIFNRIKEDRKKYRELNSWVRRQLDPIIAPLGKDFDGSFKDYFSGTDNTINKRILSAAHFYATRWEFDIIEHADPNGYEMVGIKTYLQEKQEKYYDLAGIQHLALYAKYKNFVNLCGQLRFQLRWGHINMVPRISVLGHMLIVGILSYLFSREIGSCARRLINNYFTGLFHDLPEVLTRDIISPVKRSVEGLEQLIKNYEKEQMEKEVYNLIPTAWHEEMKMFTENEFESAATVDGEIRRVSSDQISQCYNHDMFNPRDGEIVRAMDEFAAFVEAYAATNNGIRSKDLESALTSIQEKYRDKTVAGIRFQDIYRDF